MPIPYLRRRRRMAPDQTTSAGPHRPKRGWKKLFPAHFWTWRRVGQILGVSAGAIAILVIVVVAWISQSLPDPNNLGARSVAQSTKIYARDGKTVLYEIHGDQSRTVVDLSDIAPSVIQATLATEDRDFYKHSGFSIRGLARSIFVDILRGKRAQGGSTMTQQLVRTAILTREKTFTRKIKEIVLSYQIERRFTKDQILKLYFNEIPYGGSAYGVEAAARMYFGKSSKDLDLAESAMLAAIVKGPTYYSPTGNHREELLNRIKYVINNMAEVGYITPTQAEEAKKVDVLARVKPNRDPVIAPHFTFFVRDYLVQKYGELVVERGGLRVVTTLDPKLQNIAEEEVVAGAAKNDKRGADNAALLATDPKTGQILAMVGSRDFFDKDRDGQFNVTTAVRNPGSSFKPIVYLTAFSKGYSPNTLLFDLKTDFGPDGSGKNFSPNNYDGKEHGPLKMRQTLAGSLNIPAVQTLYLAGVSTTIDQAEKLGYTTIDRSKVGLALAIGGGGVTLLEHVGAFAALANDGNYNPVTPIIRVEDQRGKVLEQYTRQDKRVVDQNANRLLVDVMSDNNARAYVFGARNQLTLPDRPVAAKTGTTNDWKDGWTMGFTPSLAAGVWVGNNDYSTMNRGMDGVVVAGPIWHNFMVRATQKTPVEKFPKPKAAVESKPILQGKLANEFKISVDSETGKKIPASCLASWPQGFVRIATVKEVHNILYFVNKDAPNGAAPSDPRSDPMHDRWEKPVQQWAKRNGYLSTIPAEEDCSLRVNASTASVEFSSPQNNATITTTQVNAVINLTGFSGNVTAQYSVDGVVAATVSTTPYSSAIDLASVTNGFHTIGVSVSDDAGHRASSTISINVLNHQTATLYFVSLSPNQKISSTSLPLVIPVYAYDPSGISLIALNMEAPDGTVSVLDQVSLPGDNAVNLSLPTTTAGSYRLFISAKNKAGKTIESDRISIKIN